MLNKITLIGRLGSDPDQKFIIATGTEVSTFSVATSEKYKDKDGNYQESTEWHRVKAFGSLATICNKYLGKGSLVYLEGRIKSDTYKDREGIMRTSFEVILKEMKMLSSKETNSTTTTSQEQPSPPTKSQEVETVPEDLEDDIPF